MVLFPDKPDERLQAKAVSGKQHFIAFFEFILNIRIHYIIITPVHDISLRVNK